MKIAKYALLPLAIVFSTAATAFAGDCCPSKATATTAQVIPASYSSQENFPDMSLDELNQAIKAGKAVVIDVNGTRSFKKGRIPTALNYDALGEDGLAKALPANKDTLIVAYCGGPRCKAYKSAAKVAASLGYTNVKHFSGGISGWKDAGMEVDKG